jgi:hypothetical protein
MFNNETDENEYYSPLDALNQEDYDLDDSSIEGDDSIVECSNCGHSWDLSDSSAEDAYVCHPCGHDNFDEYSEMSSFDDSVYGMDFSEIGNVDAMQLSSYQFVDQHPEIGNNYYKVKSIGIDGSIQYSKICGF